MAYRWQYGPYLTNTIDSHGGGILDSINVGGSKDFLTRANSFYATDDNDEYYKVDGVTDDWTYDMAEHNTNTFTNTWELDGSGDFDSSVGYDHDKFGFYKYVKGTAQNDNVFGGPQPDNIMTYHGDDVIWGMKDVFDTYVAEADHDNIDAGYGNDTVYASHGDDTVYGGPGDDRLSGSFGNDWLFGQGDDDFITGGRGTDEIIGGGGNDLLSTGDLSTGDSDYVDGGAGADGIILGVASSAQTIPGEAFNWSQLALSITTDFTDLAFTSATNDTKKGTNGDTQKSNLSTAKEIVPIIVKSIRAFAEYDGSDTEIPAVEGEYATVEFDPREDILFVPINDGVSNVFVTDNTNLESDLGFTYDVGGNIFAALNLPDELSDIAKSSMADQLVKNALVIDSDGAVLGSGNSSDTIDIPDALGGTGSKFFVFGAWGPQLLEGSNLPEYIYGTNYGDILAGYTLDDGEDAETAGNGFDPASAGNDQLFGYGGNDVFMGGKSGAGNDLFFGGEGIDYASYVDSEAGINANLATVLSDTNGDYLLVSNDGFGTPDRLYSVENIIGSPQEDTVSFNDTNSTSDAAVNVKVYSSEGTQTPEEGETNVLMNVENIIGSDNSNDSISFNLDGPLTISVNSDGSTNITDSSTDQTYTVTDFENITIDSVSGTLVPSGPVNLNNFTFENVTTIETGSVIGTIDADSLAGSSLNDFITGGGGADALTGGEGADIFYFRSNDSAVDLVTDFNPSEDIILVDSGLYQIPEATAILYTQEGNNVTVSGAGTTFATIENVTVDEMNSYDTRYVTNSLPDWMTSQDIEVQIAPSEQQGYAALLPGVEAIANLPGEMIEAGQMLTIDNGGWTTFDKHPRAVGDVNNDGQADIVGFANDSVRVAISNGDGTFANHQTGLQGEFSYNAGWTSQDESPRMLGDINGDGNDDIIGFGEDEVSASLSNGDGTFATPQVVDDSGLFTHSWGWRSQDTVPRFVDDVNGDGYDDLIGFAGDGVRVALSDGDGTFGDFYTAISSDFSVSHGYTSQNVYPRMVGDINNDGRADIVGIDDNQVRFAYGQEDGTFYQPQVFNYEDSHNFLSPQQGWANQEESPRMLADINADGKDDIIGYNSVDDKLMVAYSERDTIVNFAVQPEYGFEAPVELTGISGDTIADFIGSGEYSQNLYPLMTGDITGNGQEDIIGFGTSDIFAAVWS
ncbi:MAG: FG-GAP-like repeat-containing protein [Cyanobacteria bacterium J06592_8]